MPTLFRFLVIARVIAGIDLWGDVRAGHLRRAEARRRDVRIPSDRSTRRRPARSSREKIASIMKDLGRAIEAFLEMMSAERGAADNTLQSYDATSKTLPS